MCAAALILAAGCAGGEQPTPVSRSSGHSSEPTLQTYDDIQHTVVRCLTAAGFPNSTVTLHLITAHIGLDIPEVVRRTQQPKIDACVSGGISLLHKWPLPQPLVERTLRQAARCRGDSAAQVKQMTPDRAARLFARDTRFARCLDQAEAAITDEPLPPA